jgi:hypothetical protein
LAIERKVALHIRYPPNRTQADNPPPSHSQPYPSYLSTTKNEVWCNYHNTNSHHSVDYLAIKNIHPHHTLFTKAKPTEFPKQPKVISLTNPTKADLALILMTMPEPSHHNIPLFTHNYQIKNELTTLILDNKNKNNLISQ